VKTIPTEIYQIFTKKIPPCGVVAVFIQFKNNKNFDTLEQSNTTNTTDQYIYDYMNQEEFKEFLFGQDFYRNGYIFCQQ
jgi:hypothetical protein